MTSYREGYLIEIKEMLDHAGSVWQKFAQTLAQMDFIIGKELAAGLESLYCDCTPHPHE
jgi:predicted unusual protein kinase regulating ubiquinone biosynthesis (AarF/ABC1/UbiB family)